MALTLARKLWFAQITIFTPQSINCSVGVFQYFVGTKTTGCFLSHFLMKLSISWLSDSLLCIKMASAPASLYFSALRSASSSPQPAMKASTLDTITKSGFWSLHALIFNANSSGSAKICFPSLKSEFYFGNILSSKQTPPTPIWSNFLTSLLALFQSP